MKPNRKLMCSIVFLVSMGCSHFVGGSSQKSQESTLADTNNPGGNAPVIKKAGLSSFRGIREGIANALGINLTQTPTPCGNEFESNKSNFSENFDPSKFSDAAMFSTLKLATCFCDIAASNASTRANVFGAINFALPPAQAFSIESVKEGLANGVLTSAFETHTSEDTSDLKKAISDLAAIAPASVIGTQNVVSTTCAIAFSSTKSLVL